MNVYETMWIELKQRLALADQYSIRTDITVGHVYKLLMAFEEHFKEEIEKEIQSQNDREVKNQLDLDPIDNHTPQDVAEDAE